MVSIRRYTAAYLLATVRAIVVVSFQSISEPCAYTTTHAGKMIMTVFVAIVEFERDLIRAPVSLWSTSRNAVSALAVSKG
jgi:DNA invertase Pin-like site-specific DNA recombinase